MKVNFYATLRQITGAKTVDFSIKERGTIRELVAEIVSTYPAMEQELLDSDGNLYGYVHIFVNGRDNRFLENRMDTPLYIDDKVDIFPAVGGGSSRQVY